MVVLQIHIQIRIGSKSDVAVEIHHVIIRAAIDSQARQDSGECADVDDVIAGFGIDGDESRAGEGHVHRERRHKAAI